jgi:serine/threonine protein kinase
MAYSIGDRIDGRYTVHGEVGRGGHGVVYDAFDEVQSHRVAVKCLFPVLAADPQFKIRMHREAKAMGALAGTAATQIFAFAKSPDDTLYIVMELLEGHDLEDTLRGMEARKQRAQLGWVIELLGPIASTLEKAHALGIIHRDVKPGNIFVLPEGEVRLLDFGLAKDQNAAALTAEGMVAGSPGYIAPEVWRGRAKQADGRIDVYSLAVLVFRALAGKLPFDSRQDLDKFMIQVLKGERPSLHALRPDLPPTIDVWVEKALAADPADRFATPARLWDSLRGIAGLPPESVRVETVQPWDVEIDVQIEEEVAASMRMPPVGRGF